TRTADIQHGNISGGGRAGGFCTSAGCKGGDFGCCADHVLRCEFLRDRADDPLGYRRACEGELGDIALVRSVCGDERGAGMDWLDHGSAVFGEAELAPITHKKLENIRLEFHIMGMGVEHK